MPELPPFATAADDDVAVVAGAAEVDDAGRRVPLRRCANVSSGASNEQVNTRHDRMCLFRAVKSICGYASESRDLGIPRLRLSRVIAQRSSIAMSAEKRAEPHRAEPRRARRITSAEPINRVDGQGAFRQGAIALQIFAMSREETVVCTDRQHGDPMDLGSILEAEAREKKLFFSGTHRVRAPRATIEKYRPFFPAFGITRLSNVTGLDVLGIPVWQCIRPNGRGYAIANGKGATHDAAIASAMMEGIETWHAEHCDAELIYDSWLRMRRRFRTMDPERLPRRNLQPMRPDHARMWIEGLDLVTREPMWVPTARVLFSLTAPRDGTLQEDTDGLSSGNSHAEAIVHGVCELIERDAITLWKAATDDTKVDQVNLDTIDDENCVEIINRLRGLGVVVGVWDVTMPDIEVPCYVAAISDRPGNYRAIGCYRGYGCHVDPAIALSRAITEAAQVRLTYIAGAREDIDESTGDQRATDEDLAQIEREIEGTPAPRSFRSRASLATDSPSEDIRVLVDRLRDAGIGSVVAVSLTKPEFNVPVVRIIAPHLENFEAAPGPRLQIGRSGLKARVQ